MNVPFWKKIVVIPLIVMFFVFHSLCCLFLGKRYMYWDARPWRDKLVRGK